MARLAGDVTSSPDVARVARAGAEIVTEEVSPAGDSTSAIGRDLEASRTADRFVGQSRNGRPVGTRLSVVIPTLNEAKNLPHVFAGLPPGLFEVIVVDGRSTDGTVDVARRLRSDVQVILEGRHGKGSALARGFAAARGDIIITLDADGSMDPREIPAFVAELVNGADFVKGSRHLPGSGSADHTAIRSLGNRFLTGLVNALFGTSYTDLNYGYSAFWRHALDPMTIDCEGFEVETLICIRVARAGLVMREVSCYEHRRIYGVSKLNARRDGIRVLRTIIRERARRSPRVRVDLARGDAAAERCSA